MRIHRSHVSRRTGKSQNSMADPIHHPSNIVDIKLLLLAVFRVVRVVAVLVELEADALVALVAVRVGLVDLCVFGELAVGFQGAGFVGGVLETVGVLVGCGGREGNDTYMTSPFSSW